MKTVIYLYDRTVRAVVGEVENGTITIEKVCTEEAPPLSIVNGQVTDAEAFGSFFKDFWEKNQLSEKSVYLVVDSTQTVIRFFDAPQMSHEKMMRYLPKRFIGLERMEDPVYSYGHLEKRKAGEVSRMYGIAMERRFLEEHIRRFQEMGIRLASVGTAAVAQLKLLSHLERLKDKLCIVQLLDGTTLFSVLWAYGSMVHFTRTRIKGRGTSVQIGAGCGEALDAMLQFARSQQIGGELIEVYVGGLTTSELERYRLTVHQLDTRIRLYPFTDALGGSFRSSRSAESGGWEPGKIAAAVGGLLTHPGRADLVFQYKRDPKTMAHRKAIFRFYMPFLCAAAILTAVVAVQAAYWFYLSRQVERGLDRISDPQVLTGVARYDKLTEEDAVLRERLEATEKIIKAMGTYPVMSTKIDQVVERCAKGLVTARIVSFQAENGMVLVSCSAKDERSIHQFIDRLAAEEESFSGIRYTGFEYVESGQVWRLSVECYLWAQEREEEGP